MKPAQLIAGLCVIVSFAFCGAEAVKLKNDDLHEAKKVTYSNEAFDADGKKFPREQVKQVLLGETGRTQTQKNAQYAFSHDKFVGYQKLALTMLKAEPSASGLIFLDYGRNTLTPDGKELYEYHFAGKVITQDAKDWANLAFFIEDGISRANILYARSISPDGKVTEYKPEDIKFSQPTRGTLFFGKGENMSLQIPGVDIGSIVEFGYVNEEYAPEDPELFSPQFYFQSSEPAAISRFEVRVPKGRKFFYLAQYLDDLTQPNYACNFENAAIPPNKTAKIAVPKVTETDSYTVYSWEMQDVPPLIGESQMPSMRNCAPAVFGGLYSDYKYYFKRFGDFHREHMKKTPQIDSLANSLVQKNDPDSVKVAKIYHWMQRNIRYISIKGALSSRFGGHYAQITLDNKYGDCIDKAILFATLLGCVNVDAYPIILLTNDAGFMQRDLFPFWGGNHAISEIWWNKKPHILDATGNLFRFPYYSNGDADIWYVNYVRNEVVYNPPQPPADNAMKSRTKLVLKDTNIAEISDSMWFSGEMEAGYRGYFEFTPEMRHKQVVEQMVAGRKAGSKLSNFAVHNVKDISQPFSLNFAYTVADYLVSAGKYFLLELPSVRYSFPEVDLRNRNYGIKISDTYQRTHDITIDIANNYKIVTLPSDITVSNEYFDYTAKFERSKSSIRFTDTFNRKKLRIPVEDYDKYKADALRVLAYQKGRIFLEK